MSDVTKTEEIAATKEEVKEERFYVLKVHEHMTKNAPILMATKATSYAKAKKHFELMRSKMPVIDPSKYTIVDAYDLTDPIDHNRLMTHHANYGQILFYIKKTAIDSIVPIEFHKDVADINFVKNQVCICNYVDKKVLKDPKILLGIEESIQKNLLTLKTDRIICVNEKESDEVVINRLNAGDDMVFVITDKTITETINFTRHIYELAKGKTNDITFMYSIPDDNILYYIEIDEDLKLRKIDI